MALNVYLYFDGDCKQAIDFYANVFDVADEDKRIMTYKDAPDFEGNPEDADRVIHSEIKINDMKILMSDVAKGTNLKHGNNFALLFNSKDESQIRNAYSRLADGGKVHLPLQESFFTALYANLTDKFGTSWQLTLEK